VRPRVVDGADLPAEGEGDGGEEERAQGGAPHRGAPPSPKRRNARSSSRASTAWPSGDEAFTTRDCNENSPSTTPHGAAAGTDFSEISGPSTSVAPLFSRAV